MVDNQQNILQRVGSTKKNKIGPTPNGQTTDAKNCTTLGLTAPGRFAVLTASSTRMFQNVLECCQLFLKEL